MAAYESCGNLPVAVLLMSMTIGMMSDLPAARIATQLRVLLDLCWRQHFSGYEMIFEVCGSECRLRGSEIGRASCRERV